MPSFSELATDIRANLNDQNITFFTAQNIYDAMQDAYSLSVWLTKSIEKSLTLTQRFTLYWDFPQIIPDFLSLVGIFSLTKKQWLEPKWPKEMLEMRQDWERWRGTPIWMVQGDSRRTALVPWPSADNSTQQLIVVYRAIAPIIQSAALPKLPLTRHNMIEHYATGQLMAMAKEFKQANFWYKQFFDAVSSAKKLVKDKTSADRINVLEPYQVFGRYPYTAAGDSDVHIDNEVPAGTIDGVNDTFTLANNPNPPDSLELYKNGLLMYQGLAYNLTGNSIVFTTDYIPAIDDTIIAFYRLS